MRTAHWRMILAAVAISTAIETVAGNDTPKPNIVFIMADDLGWGDVGFHGGTAPTPNLDRLAAEGLELTRHYVAPVCSPTRSALMTGRSWSRFDVTNPQNDRALPWTTVTLPRALKSAGYQTWIAGKWHLGSKPEWGPLKFGFERSFGSLAGGVSPYSHKYKKGPFADTWHRDDVLIEQSGHVTDLITAEALERLEGRDSQRPFFLYVPFTAVHLPVNEPKAWVERVPKSIDGELQRHYAACVMHLDDAVGRIVSKLEALGIRNDTLVVFTSDNGGSWAENDDRSYTDDDCPAGKLPGVNRPWRGQKGQLYEGGIRVPAIVSFPGHIKPGKVDAPVQIIDWMPTLTALAGYRPEADLKWDGIDLRKLLKDHIEPSKRAIYSVAPGWRSRSLHFGDSKLIEFTVVGKPARYELYDLAADPGETRDVSTLEPDELSGMKALLNEAAKNDRDARAKDEKPE